MASKSSYKKVKVNQRFDRSHPKKYVYLEMVKKATREVTMREDRTANSKWSTKKRALWYNFMIDQNRYIVIITNTDELRPVFEWIKRMEKRHATGNNKLGRPRKKHA